MSYLERLDRLVARIGAETWANEKGKRSVLTGLAMARALYLNEENENE